MHIRTNIFITSNKTLLLLLMVLMSLSFNAINAQSKSKFKVVLDAGHGGKDSGMIGHQLKEKNIALEITKKVGAILNDENDIDIIFTRQSDVFVELTERANIANKNNADLFVSIHCNSAGKNFSPYGTETYVMGMSRSDLNFDVAKSENSVILLESDYKEKYNGFDPNKPESLIGLKILQEEYLSQSIELASKIESNFVKKLGRKSRGVKQQPLWVLDASYMPSVLIETGFLTNRTEGAYLNSSKGKDEMASAIANAIIDYKSENFVSNVINSAPKSKEVTNHVKEEQSNENIKNNTVFKIQVSASKNKLTTVPSNFKGLSPISRERVGKLYKYFYSEEGSYFIAKKRLEEAKEKGYSSAFIVAYKEGVKINLSEAIK